MLNYFYEKKCRHYKHCTHAHTSYNVVRLHAQLSTCRRFVIILLLATALCPRSRRGAVGKADSTPRDHGMLANARRRAFSCPPARAAARSNEAASREPCPRGFVTTIHRERSNANAAAANDASHHQSAIASRPLGAHGNVAILRLRSSSSL